MRWLQAPSREARDTGFMLLMIGWTIAPHLGHLSPWVGLLAFAVLAWRGLLAWRQAPLPGKRSVLALLLLAAALTWWTQRTLLGKEAGVTLLVVLMALKTLELRARRDALVVFFLGFFLVLTHFLYSQSLLTALAMALSVWGWLTALTLAHMTAGRPPLWQAARLAGRAALVGTPVMLLLFLLFPRVGPLWSLPNDGGKTGLSDRLEMGNVADLANDDSIAMRVQFEGAAPPTALLYFRGPVLADTDGRTWLAEGRDDRVHRGRMVSVTARSPAEPGSLRYTVSLEPTSLTWLPLLELTLPSPAGEPSAVEALDPDAPQIQPDTAGQWRTRQPITQRLRLRVTAAPGAAMDAAHPPADLRRYLRLPPEAHPRTRAWVSSQLAAWADAQGQLPDPGTRARRVLAHLNQAGFRYTLQPGLPDGDPVDVFWLDGRAGFCEHFATGFVVVMRLMGVPARVVTGYQGTDPAPVDGDWVVRQSYAHAWAEIWLEGRGWQRVDPTAAVAPDRIERARALRPPPGLVGGAIDAMTPGLRQQLRAWAEHVDARWTRWVLSYDRRGQFDLLRQLGVDSPDTEALGRVMVAVLSAGALLGAGMAWRDARRQTPGQRWQRRLQWALRPLARHGLVVGPAQPPAALATWLLQRWGAAAGALAARLQALEADRYGPPGRQRAPTSADWRALRAEARALARLPAPAATHLPISTAAAPAAASAGTSAASRERPDAPAP